MTLTELIKLTSAELITENVNISREISSGYACDLLSWVMSHGKADMAWITVQTHLNVIAVASLMDMACVILPEGIVMGDEVLKKAEDEGVAVLYSNKTAYEICGLLYSANITTPERV